MSCIYDMKNLWWLATWQDVPLTISLRKKKKKKCEKSISHRKTRKAIMLLRAIWLGNTKFPQWKVSKKKIKYIWKINNNTHNSNLIPRSLSVAVETRTEGHIFLYSPQLCKPNPTPVRSGAHTLIALTGGVHSGLFPLSIWRASQDSL